MCFSEQRFTLEFKKTHVSRKHDNLLRKHAVARTKREQSESGFRTSSSIKTKY